jgi:HSP20 family protein
MRGIVMPVKVHAWGSDFESLTRKLWATMDEMERRTFFRSRAPSAWRPRLNVYETPEEFIICAELAGVSREQIDLHIDGGRLVVRGIRAKPTVPVDTSVSVHLMEIDSGQFVRELAIPSDVDVERTTASYRDGYLWVFLPRKPKREDTPQ